MTLAKSPSLGLLCASGAARHWTELCTSKSIMQACALFLGFAEPQFATWLSHDAPASTAPLRATFLNLALWQWIAFVLVGALSAAAGFALSHGLLRMLGVLAGRTRVKWDELLIGNLRQPAAGLVTLLVLRALTPALELGDNARSVIGKVLVVAFIATLT